jgi:hypothetical protein
VAAQDFTTVTPQEVETAVRATAERMDWGVPGKALRLPSLAFVLADLGVVYASGDTS